MRCGGRPSREMISAGSASGIAAAIRFETAGSGAHQGRLAPALPWARFADKSAATTFPLPMLIAAVIRAAALSAAARIGSVAMCAYHLGGPHLLMAQVLAKSANPLAPPQVSPSGSTASRC
jgi:hypothetical protein